MALIDRGVDYDVGSRDGPARRAARRAERARARAPRWAARSTSHLTVLDYDDLRGALRRDAARPHRARRPGRAARLHGRGMKRRTLRCSAARARSARRRCRRRRRCRPALPAATPAQTPAAADLWALSLRSAGRRRARLRRFARQAAAAEFLGHLVRALRHRDAAARSLSRAQRRPERLAGARPRGRSRRTPVRDFLPSAPVSLPVAWPASEGIELSRRLGNTAGGAAVQRGVRRRGGRVARAPAGRCSTPSRSTLSWRSVV